MGWTVVGDPHVTHKSLDRAQKLFSVVERQGKSVIWTGDLLDTKEVIRGKCLNAFFEYFKSSKLNHVILVGNHDWFNLECKDHSLKTLSALPNVVVIDKPTVMGNITYIPYIHDLGLLKAELLKVATPYCVAHLDVANFDYGNGQLCEKGVTLKDFAHIKLLVSGHFHKFQAKENLVYIGSPFSHSFGESDQTKYLGYWDDLSGTLSTFETELPKHKTLQLFLDDLQPLEDLDIFFELNSENFVRCILHGSQAQIASFPRDRFSEFSIKWVPRPTETGMNNKIVLEEGVDNIQQFVKWAREIKKLDESTLERGLLILGALNAK